MYGFQVKLPQIKSPSSPIYCRSHFRRKGFRFTVLCKKKRCRRCGENFSPEVNHDKACRFHGGILGDRAYFNWTADWLFGDGCPADRLVLIQRWTCCGATTKNARGCKNDFHVSHDTDLEGDCNTVFLHDW
ncbi:uncharacterized protein Gasu_52310 [Galdieria sulphuraria]|uniref:Uncharacterized protein n=1 Tax=Galdieria sulphuraria TaxID=130081 RepID=M2XTY7_GALSU|nr:uncharacterized protein Gasu_52310 [Galdieria sulphuraria]EME27128.1 hypothetical protein Gasu_52310 [Galdieria sulphuraria]|eukprot:XP_005703648.1 hypothetical protein Gasu_52310 [Galdieria sulphuraria]